MFIAFDWNLSYHWLVASGSLRKRERLHTRLWKIFGSASSKTRIWPPHAARLMNQVQSADFNCKNSRESSYSYSFGATTWCDALSWLMVRQGLNHWSFGRESDGVLQDLQHPSWSHSCAAGANAISSKEARIHKDVTSELRKNIIYHLISIWVSKKNITEIFLIQYQVRSKFDQVESKTTLKNLLSRCSHKSYHLSGHARLQSTKNTFL